MGKHLEALIAKAEAEYPGKFYLQGDDEYFNQFAQGKIYVNGQFVRTRLRMFPIWMK